jgi:hypothetical protein
MAIPLRSRLKDQCHPLLSFDSSLDKLRLSVCTLVQSIDDVVPEDGLTIASIAKKQCLNL